MKQQIKQPQEKEIDTNKPTKHYDVIATNVRKLLSASAQTFIPQLCDALRQDWAPELSDEQIRRQFRFQKLIRNKIYAEWSKEGGYSDDNIWSENTITLWWPNWLKNPIQQQANEDNWQKSLEVRRQKQAQKSLISTKEKATLEKFATNLPKTVIIPEEKPKPYTSEEMTDLGFRPTGDAGKTMFQIVSEIKGGAERCFRGLCDDKTMPFADEDLLVDYIKPTREFRLNVALELNKSERADLHNVMHNLIEAAEDMIEQIAKADQK